MTLQLVMSFINSYKIWVESSIMAKELKLMSAPWCGPCKMVKKVLEQKEITVDVVDIDAEPETAMKYGIRAVPTLLVFDENGTVVQQQTGDPIKIVKIIEENQ